MGKEEDKIRKKEAKAKAKTAKKRAKQEAEKAENIIEAADRSSDHLPGGIGITIQGEEENMRLIVSGLSRGQLNKIIPQINKEIEIAVMRDRNVFRATVLRFFREGLFQTAVKVAAGLIVAFLLMQLGF